MAYETPCYQGLAYSVEKHVCDYPDNVAYCDKQTESVVGFKCPAPHELPPNAVARRFLPFPRFPKPGDETAYIVVSCECDQAEKGIQKLDGVLRLKFGCFGSERSSISAYVVCLYVPIML